MAAIFIANGRAVVEEAGAAPFPTHSPTSVPSVRREHLRPPIYNPLIFFFFSEVKYLTSKNIGKVSMNNRPMKLESIALGLSRQ